MGAPLRSNRAFRPRLKLLLEKSHNAVHQVSRSKMLSTMIDAIGSPRTTLTLGPIGRQTVGSVGPNSAIVGIPMIPAKWIGPVSFPITDDARERTI